MVEPTNGDVVKATDFNAEIRALSVLFDRQVYMRMNGLQFDGKRDLYAILGYDRIVTTQQYRDEYARGGIAKTIVEAFPKATWADGCGVYEDEDPDVSTVFEKAVDDADRRVHVWNALYAADVLAGQSTYSVVLIGAPGALDTELPRNGKLLYLQPYFGGGGPTNNRMTGTSSTTQAADADVTIESFDTDPTSERFGEPRTYRIRRTDFVSPQMQVPVHWSRVIHVCEGALDNRVYGVPTLEAVWNRLFDLEKVTGGGSEGFFQRAKHVLNLNLDKETSLSPTQLQEMKDKFEEYQHGLTTMLPTRGVDVKLVESMKVDFSSAADAILTQIAGITGIPKRILTGSEMGELASTQDAANFNKRVDNRRSTYAAPMMVRKLFDRLIDYGYLPTPAQYDVEWPTEEEDKNGQADFAVKLATVNKTQGDTVFTDAEIREMAFDKKPLTAAQLKEINDKAMAKVQMAQEAMGGADPNAEPVVPAKKQPSNLRAAEDREVLRVLERAIRVGDRETVDRIVGLQEPKFGSTQIQLPPSVADKLLAFGQGIPDESLDPQGREADAHVTVKYGLLAPDAEALAQVPVLFEDGRQTRVGKAQRLRMTLGKTAFFAAPDYDVVYVSVDSPDLVAINRAIGAKLKCAPSDYARYVPHATVAYVKSGLGQKYAGWAFLDGVEVTVRVLVLTDVDGNQVEVALG